MDPYAKRSVWPICRARALVSIAWPSAISVWRALFAEADRALYVAKERGRDQYVLASAMVSTDDAVRQPDCISA